MEKSYKISVIVPIYNVEPYLEEALDSVIKQTLSFKKNIQVILVNDGSTDNSETICKRYEAKYPKNIVYVYKENGGVSSARNMGFEYATGKYITFLDPDDKWERDSFKKLYKFMEKHYDEIDVAVARVQFFEANENYHTFDYKFDDGTRIADLTDKKELYTGQSTAATTMIKREALGDLRFDTELKYGEDSIFINKLILKKKKVGIVKEALYRYRKRLTSDSAVNNQVRDRAFYIDTLRNYHLELMRYCKEMYGEIIPYVQAMISYDIYWRFSQNTGKKVLSQDDYELFLSLAKQVLSNIDDEILLRNPAHRSISKKSAVVRAKYGIELSENLKFDPEKKSLFFNNIRLFKIDKNDSRCCFVGKSDVEGDNYVLDIFVARWVMHSENRSAKFFVKFGDEKVYPEQLSDYHCKTALNSFGEKEDYYYHYHCEYPVGELKSGEGISVYPYIEFENGESTISMVYGKFVPNRVDFPKAYKFYDRYLVKNFKGHIYISCPADVEASKVKHEKECLKYLEENDLKDVAKIRRRFKNFEKKELSKGEIWLFADRIDNAGDNGEAMFKYVCEHKPNGVRPMFMIGEGAKSDVVSRLRSEGEVIFAEDKDYPYYFLMAKKLVTSSGGEFTINPFGPNRKYLIDMFKYRYYFTNHGVNCGNCSTWLNKFNKKIDVFFTTGVNETQRIIDDDYLYTKEQLVITGLPRYDLLYEDTKKQILILPTWRRAIKESYDQNTSSVYFDGFKNTEYFKFYNGLINDEKLLSAMREQGYKGIFCLHPIHMKQSVDFQENDVFRINNGFVDYNKVFAESAVLVTDYSTIAFDFAHLKKPIVYSQFDQDEFYENQIYGRGFFDYYKDGFGPVCETREKVVNELISLIENDCKNNYIDKVENFFYYLDDNNCKRVYEKLISEM